MCAAGGHSEVLKNGSKMLSGSVNGEPRPTLRNGSATLSGSVNGEPRPTLRNGSATLSGSVNGEPRPTLRNGSAMLSGSVNGEPRPTLRNGSTTLSSSVSVGPTLRNGSVILSSSVSGGPTPLLHLDYLYDERHVELPDFLAALPDGRVQDLPGGQLPPDRQVPYTAQLQAASSMAMALRRRMPSRVCAVCSELCSEEDSSVQSFNTIPNVDLLRADIMCTAAVSRCAHTLAWRRVACTAQGTAPPPPDPVLPFRYRARRNDRRANTSGEDSTGTDAAAVLLDDDIRGAEDMSDACDEEEENRQQEQPQPSLPPELQPKPPRVLPRPCSEDGACVEVPYCMRLEANLPNRTMLVDAAGVERIFLCQNCESALTAGRIPEAALARLDPGDVPRINHLGDPLPTPTFLESQVLSRARVMQQILVLHLAGRPPDVYPQAVRAHGVAIASADPRLWRGLLPARAVDLAGSITVLCIDRVQNQHELRERVWSAPALQVRGAVIVAWVRFLQHAEEDEWGIDSVAMDEYERMGCAPYVPEELVDNAVGPTDEEVADVLRTTFMHDRTGNAGVRQRQDEVEAAVAEDGTTSGGTGPTDANADGTADADGAVDADVEDGRAFAALLRTAPATQDADATEAPEVGRLDELEVVLPQPSNVPDDGSEICSAPWVVEDLLTGRARLVISTGAHGGRPLDEHHPAILTVCFPSSFPYGLSGQRPLGMSNPAYMWHLVRRVPRAQFAGNPMLLARMYDISVRQATMAQVGVALHLKPDLEHDVARLPRDAARAMGVILSLPYNHPQRRQLLAQQSPVVQALVEGARLSTLHVDLTDTYYNGAQATMRAVGMAIGWGALFFTINPADMHAGAAIIASGQVVEFEDSGRPRQLPSVVDKWRRVRDDPYSCAALLVATKEVLVEELFGFAPGAQQQTNPHCFCGTTFEVAVKVEQSGRLALHLHGIAHVAAFAVERLQALFSGPNCRALALAYALCQQWYPSPYYDPAAPAEERHVFGLTAEAAREQGVAPPATDKQCPRAAYDFERLAGCTNGSLPPPAREAVIREHHAAVIRTTLTHAHSDTCVRHGCIGADGSCGMMFPRLTRPEFRWIGTQGLFLLPRLGCNIVPHFPAAAVAFGCNQLFSLSCEMDRSYTREVAAKLNETEQQQAEEGTSDQPPPPCEPLGSAADRARDAGYYTSKYTSKTIARSQSDRLCSAVVRVQDFLLSGGGTAGSGAGHPAPAENSPTAFGNLAAAAHH
ncbi:hypothetical protein PLESTF_000549700 [Pleodorina starrii]|nr:hypothetical protein PLESTF_000549700 [Pleodorina starrii]